MASSTLHLSRLAFGTGSLHHVGKPERARLLFTACDAGITHFDTAPLYGFGLAEVALAQVLRSRRASTVATKVGLYPPGGPVQSEWQVLFRKAAGKLCPPLSRPHADLSVARARASLRDSLRRLGRDHVDLLLLHEPDHALLATDEWQRWLESERQLVGAFGICGETDRMLPFAMLRAPFAALIQTRDSLERKEAAPLRRHGYEPQLTYGHLARLDAGADAAATLVATARQFPATTLLLSTRRPDRISTLARALEAARD